MNAETKKRYYTAEFKCMGDVLKNGLLNEREFSRLMRLLGVYDQARVQYIWRQQQKQYNQMTVDEYVRMMFDDPDFAEQTSMWRKLFHEFDTDGSGYASREDVINGLHKMGIAVDKEMRAKIQAMDSGKKDHIYYGDFLKMQLLHKCG